MDQALIYERHAAEYDALVAAEDCDGHLLPALEAVAPLAGAALLEVGVGTGRITRLLLPRVACLVGIERAPAMLEVARRHVAALSPAVAARCELQVADARHLPVGDGWADIALAGWVFGHFRKWLPDDWRAEIEQGLAEMDRALKPGGTLLLIETLGTGQTEPAPPNPALAEYYAWLEVEQGMTRTSLRTDYLFPDAATAAAVTGFFFGEAFAERVREAHWKRIPECTGIWSRTAPRLVSNSRPGTS